MRGLRRIAGGVAAGGLACCAADGPRDAASTTTAPASDQRSAAWFTEVAQTSGIRFQHRSGARGEFQFPEIMGGGAGWLDFDGDGFLDAYLVDSGELPPLPMLEPGTAPEGAAGTPRAPIDGGTRSATTTRAAGAGSAALAASLPSAGGNRLFRNDGHGHFQDVTARAGVGGGGYGMGCAAADFDNDGRPDLYVLNLGPNILYRNNGDGTFSDVTAAAGVGDPGWSASAAFVDYDRDGDLDLFVVNYVDWTAQREKKCYAVTGARDYCSPQSYGAPAYATLYRNSGDGKFTDVTREAGLRAKAGTGLGAVCSDFNGDGHVDLYVANDQMPSFLWLGRGDGTFVESAAELGCAVDETGLSQAGMGVVAADVDDDGDLDLWKVHLHREAAVLYLNHGTHFDEATRTWGLAAPTRRYTGFGTGLVDFDCDGLLDIFVANGRVQFVNEPTPVADIYAERNQLLRQVRPGRFEDATAAGGAALALVETSRGAAFGDYDNDGDVDILIVNRDGPARLLRNDAPRQGGSVTLRVLDRHGRDAVGARLHGSIGGRERMFEVSPHYSYASTNDPRVHVGLGDRRRVERVRVRWPTGEQVEAGPFEAGTFPVIRPPGIGVSLR